MRQSAFIIFYGVLAYHIQHSHKLIYSRQHFFQALLQAQDLEEKSLKEKAVKCYTHTHTNYAETKATAYKSNEWSQSRTYVCPLHFKFSPTHQLQLEFNKMPLKIVSARATGPKHRGFCFSYRAS